MNETTRRPSSAARERELQMRVWMLGELIQPIVDWIANCDDRPIPANIQRCAERLALLLEGGDGL